MDILALLYTTLQTVVTLSCLNFIYLTLSLTTDQPINKKLVNKNRLNFPKQIKISFLNYIGKSVSLDYICLSHACIEHIPYVLPSAM